MAARFDHHDTGRPRRAIRPPQVFLSYRRDDSKHLAGRIALRIAQEIGEDRLFFDVNTIKPGSDFLTSIESSVIGSDLLIALIGPAWMGIHDGRRRIDDPDDHVVAEIRTALQNGVRVVPVLADGAMAPTVSELPEQIKALGRLQATRIDHDTFVTDIQALLDVVGELSTGVAGRSGEGPEAGSRWRIAGGVATVLGLLIGVVALSLPYGAGFLGGYTPAPKPPATSSTPTTPTPTPDGVPSGSGSVPAELVGLWSGGPGSETKLELDIRPNGAYEFHGLLFGSSFVENGRLTVRDDTLTFEPTLSGDSREPRRARWERTSSSVTNVLSFTDTRYGYFSFVQIG